jgi:LysR family hydrogen peroxide-inducible transcriptional activator
MTLNQLKYAIELEKKGSFKKAADSLEISQPALSLQIQKLEEELGIILFDRKSSPIQTTDDGKLFIVRAEEIISSVDNLSEFVSEKKRDFGGLLKVGVIPTLAPYLIPLFVKDLQKDYPNLELDFQELITENIIKEVRNGSLDAGIISTPVDVYGIKHDVLFYEKFFLYVSESQENNKHIDLQTIEYNKLWILNEGNCFRDQINDFCNVNKINKNKKFIFKSNSIDALIRMVDTVGGMTILPELTTLVLSEEQENRIGVLEQKAREISIITRQIEYKSRFIEKLTEYIKKNIPKPLLTNTNLEIVDPGINII